MRLLRVLLAGLITVAALVAGFFAAVVILVTGAVAFVVQFFWKRQPPTQPGPARGMNQPAPRRTDDVIDVVATKVSTDPTER